MTTLVNTGSASLAKTLEAAAKALAGKESTEMQSIVAKIHDARLETQGGPVRVMFAWVKAIGEEGMNALPEVGTEAGKDATNNPERFKIEVEGSDTSRMTSFYAIYAQNTVKGRFLANRRRMLTLAKQGHLAEVSDDIKVLAESEITLTQEIKDVENELTNITSAYRNAAKFYQKLRDFNALTGVSAEPVMNADGTDLQRTAKPVLVKSATDVAKFRFFSVNTFMGMDVSAIKEAGGTYAAMLKEIEREGGKGQGKGKNAVPKVTDLDGFIVQFRNSMDYIGAILDNPKGEAYGKLFKKLNAGGSDDLLLAFSNAKTIGEAVFRNDRLAARYAELEEGGVTKAA